MSKLYSSSEIIKVLEKFGFREVSRRGSHVKYRKYEGQEEINVIVKVPAKEVPKGTFRSILRQSRLKKEDFEENV